MTNFIMILTDVLLGALSFIVLFNVILSWILPPNHTMKQFFEFLAGPILNPIRNLMRPLMAKSSLPLDLSPFIVLFLIAILRNLLRVLWQSL